MMIDYEDMTQTSVRTMLPVQTQPHYTPNGSESTSHIINSATNLEASSVKTLESNASSMTCTDTTKSRPDQANLTKQPIALPAGQVATGTISSIPSHLQSFTPDIKLADAFRPAACNTSVRPTPVQSDLQEKAPLQMAQVMSKSHQHTQSNNHPTEIQITIKRETSVSHLAIGAKRISSATTTSTPHISNVTMKRGISQATLSVGSVSSVNHLRTHTPPPSRKPPAPPVHLSARNIDSSTAILYSNRNPSAGIQRHPSSIHLGSSTTLNSTQHTSKLNIPSDDKSSLPIGTHSSASASRLFVPKEADRLSHNSSVYDDRRHILSNLLRIQTQAEALYVRRLEVLRDRFYEPLKRRYANVRRWITLGIGGSGSRAERLAWLDRIFASINPLLNFHEDFLRKLRTLERLALASSVRAVVGLFKKRMQGFETDIEYLRHYPMAIATFENLCVRDSRFRKIVKACEIDAGYVNVRAYLDTPKEQLRRYTQFMERIVDLCSLDSFDRTEACECLVQIKALVDRASPYIQQADDISEAAAVHFEVANLPDAVLSPNQRLMYKGMLRYRLAYSGSDEQWVRCYLLRDRLVLAVDETQTNHTSSSDGAGPYVHHRTIFLSEARLKPVYSDSTAPSNTICIITLQGEHYLSASNEDDYYSWSRAVYQVKDQLPVEVRVVPHSKSYRHTSILGKQALSNLHYSRLMHVRRALRADG